MREGPLHAAVKAMLAAPGDRVEVPVGRFVIDLVRADGELVEVQTGGFGALGKKLDALLDELVAFPSLLSHPNLTIEVLLLREDHIRRPQPVMTRGRTRDPGERRLVEVLDRIALRTAEDVLALLPALPVDPFSTRELAACFGCTTMLARRALYCLRAMGIVEPVGKRGRAPLHRLKTERDLPSSGGIRAG
jgi:hypothetical protein